MTDPFGPCYCTVESSTHSIHFLKVIIYIIFKFYIFYPKIYAWLATEKLEPGVFPLYLGTSNHLNAIDYQLGQKTCKKLENGKLNRGGIWQGTYPGKRKEKLMVPCNSAQNILESLFMTHNSCSFCQL